jgi:hypothetical protein
MKLLSKHVKVLAIGAIATAVMFSAYAGSGDEALEAAVFQYQSVDSRIEWQNTWMPQASANAVAISPSGDLLMGEIVASYSRSILDRGGWENTLMTNSEYTAANPLLAVGVGSGATSLGVERMQISDQLALL